MPKTARTLIFKGADQAMEIRDINIPALKQGEILIKNEYTTLCKSDILTFSGRRKEKTPTILGHEIVGRIEKFGPDSLSKDVRGHELQRGDRVSWAIYASNPGSKRALQGIPQKAEDLFKYGHETIRENQTLHGGLSQYTLLRPFTPIAKIHESIPLAVAATINCAIATVAGAFRLAGSVQGKRILISGAGMLGVIACAMGKSLGANQIIAIDIDEKRLPTAQTFGADLGFLSAKDSEINLVDIVLEFSGYPKAIKQAIPMLDIGGSIILVGSTFPQKNLELNAEKIVRNLTTIKGLHNYNQEDFRAAIEFIEKHHQQFPFESLIYDHFTLSQTQDAFEYAVEKKPFRVGIRINT